MPKIINTKRDFFEAIFLLASVQFRLGKISLALANYIAYFRRHQLIATPFVTVVSRCTS